MACSNSRYNVILLSLGLLLYCSLSQCTALKRKKFHENSLSLSKSNSERLNWIHGKLFIGLKTERDGNPKETKNSEDFGDVDLDYQSDMTWEVPGLPTGQEYVLGRYDNSAVERLLKMDPLVDCSGGSMRLQVQDADSKPGSLLFVDRGDLSPLPLSKLPKSCGYKIGSTRRDLIMVAPYDGCFVVVEESRYVLPLRWFGLPVRMSCPLSQPSTNPPMVTCHAGGMVVKTDWALPPSEIKVNLNGKWEPLTQASPRCGFGVVEHPEGVAISIGYNPCMQKKDGMYSMKLSGEGEVKLSCPPLASADSTKESMMDVGLLSTSAPTQNVIITPQVPDDPSLSQTWHQFYPLPWYPHQPKPEPLPVQPGVPQPADDKMVGQPFYPLFPEQPLPDRPNQGSVPSALEESLGQFYYPYFYPQEPPYEEPAYPPQPEYPYPEWYLPEQPVPQPAYPFFIPQDPVKPTAASEPQTTKPPKPEGPVPPPFYLYPLFHPTEQPEVPTTTASPQVPQGPQYQFFGPYYYPLPSQHPPHTTTPPTPSPQKPQDPPNSQQGTVVLLPQNPQPDTPAKPPMECPQYCPVGIPNCCPQIAFHHHLYHFVPLEKNGNANPPAFPTFPGLSRFTSGLRPDLGYAAQTAPQEAQALQSRTAFTNALVSPQFPLLRGQHEEQTYHQPPEGNIATLHDRSEQTDTQQPSHSHYVPNVYFPYRVNMNQREHQSLPESLSGVAPKFYSEMFDPVHRRNIYVPYNMQYSQQSDGPSSNFPTRNLMSRNRQYTSQSNDNTNSNVNGPSNSVFRSQPDPLSVPYHTLQESQDNFSNNPSKYQQPFNVFRKPAKREETGRLSPESRSYVLLQHEPPGRQGSSFQSPPFRPVVESDNMGPNFASNPQNKPPQLQGESDDLKWLVKENSGNADLTPGDEPGPLPQLTASVGPNSAPLSQDPAVSGKPNIHQSFRHSQKHFLPFGYRRRTSHPNVLQ